MAEPSLTDDQQALAQLYQQTIDHHQNYLDRLHEAFDKRCEVIGAGAKEKLKSVDEKDEEARQQILMEEQEQLDRTLEELKSAINKSNADARKKLEEIQVKIDQDTMDLENELADL